MPVLTQQQADRVQANVSAMQGRGISAQQARNHAQEFAIAMNGRGLPVDEVPPEVKQWALEHPVRIFNVGPWAQKRELGTLGTFFIPACPEGQPYVEMTKTINVDGRQKVVPALEGLIFEPIREEGRFSVRQHRGIDVAHDIVGIGPFMAKENALAKFGVFISANGEPTKEELTKAKAELYGYLRSMVADARKAERDGKTDQVVGPDHYTAARMLKLDPKVDTWMTTRVVEENTDACPGCGRAYRRGTIAICPTDGCRVILDEEKYKTLKRAS